MTTVITIPTFEFDYSDLLRWCDYLLTNLNNSEVRHAALYTSNRKNDQTHEHISITKFQSQAELNIKNTDQSVAIVCTRRATPNGEKEFIFTWLIHDHGNIRKIISSTTGLYDRAGILNIVSDLQTKHHRLSDNRLVSFIARCSK